MSTLGLGCSEGVAGALRGTAWVGRGRNSLSCMRLVIRLLGPLEVECGDRPVRIGAAKERLILVLLALNAGRVVAAERLVDALWGEAPPESAGVSLRVLISRLRKGLAAAGCNAAIQARPP